MSHPPVHDNPVSEPGIPALPPDDENPAIIDAHRTFLWTVIGAALFIGSVVTFIL